MSTFRILVGLLAVCQMASVAGAALSPEARCQDAIAVQGRKYFQRRFDAVSKCRNLQAKGFAISCGPGDPDVAPKLAAAESVLANKLGVRCTDALLASELVRPGLPCGGVATVADLIACLVDDGHGADADNLLTTVYDASGAIADSGVRACQATLAKEARKLASARLKHRRTCARRLTQGKIDGPCPDATARAGLAKALDKFTTRIQGRCTDAQALDASLDLGFPCEQFANVTFDRVGNTNANAIAPVDRLLRCIASAAAGDGDLGAETGYPLPEPNPATTYSVAAGDATDTSFVAWTRGSGGFTPPITLVVSTAPDLSSPVATIGGLSFDAAADDTLQADVGGLAADTQYYYAFTNGTDTSPIGRIRTAPAPASTAPIRFAWTGDSNAFFKPYTVLEQITADDPQAWFYVGDTIYGDDPRSGSGVAMTRADYHAKYRENRDDHSLRDVLANVGVYTIWDDHEVTNDFWGTDSSIGAMIDAGNQAFRDYFPVRENGGDPQQLYRSFKWGEVAEFFLIDDRQYRDAPAYVTEPACLDNGEPATVPPAGACTTEIANPARTYLGATQLAWLEAGLAGSTATWKFVMNGPLVSTLLFVPYDRWEGYAAERFALLDFIAANDVKNVVFLSTDIHAAIANDAVDVGQSPGPRPRELVSGAIGMDPIFRELPGSIIPVVPTLPGIFTTIRYFDLDRFNVALVTADQTQATVVWKDNAGQVLKTYVMATQ